LKLEKLRIAKERELAELAKVTGFEQVRKQKGMSASQFYAIPKNPPSASKLPIYDAAHVRNAMARFNQIQGVSDAEKATAKRKIIAAAKKFGIDVKNFAKLGKKEDLNIINEGILIREEQKFDLPIKINEELSKDSDSMYVEGVALAEGKWNGMYYPEELLEEGYSQLIGKPLRLAHFKTPSGVAGKIVKSWYDPENKQIKFQASVFSELAKNLINEGAKNVSVGVLVDRYRTRNGVTAKNPEFREISIVDRPACEKSKIKPMK
jgi:hypothetical protein